MDPRDREFADIAVELGFVARADVDAVLRAGAPKPVGQQLLERGLITFDQLGRVLELQKQRYMARAEGTPLPAPKPVAVAKKVDPFGHIAIAKGYVTPAQVDECVREQEEMTRRGAKIALGQVLIKKRYLSTERFLEILKIQEQSILRCDKCGTRYESAVLDSTCGVCGGRVGISTTQFEATVRAETPGPLTMFQRKEGRRLGPGERFGKYEILEELGRGGMGIVFKARHRDLQQVVAVKILRTEGADEAGIKRFYREARTAANLRHPNIVPVHDVGVEGDCHYIAMEFIEGERMDVLLQQQKLALLDSLRILGDVARALGHAHARNIIHRDVKPGNIMVENTGRPLVLDFGLAKTLGSGSMLTKTGSFLGTPYYMAPEQVRGITEEIDRRADIYALGVIAFEAATGTAPFTGSTAMEVYQKIVTEPAAKPSSRKPGLPRELDRLVLKALEKEPKKRHATAEEFADEAARVPV